MNETRNELTKQRQREIHDMQQAFSKDAAKQMQPLYDQIQVCLWYLSPNVISLDVKSVSFSLSVLCMLFVSYG